MAHPDQLTWRWIEDLSLPYSTRENPAQSKQLLYVGGSNVVTWTQNSVQRRPGFENALEDTPTTFSGDIRRLFGWRTWAGISYVMLNEVTGSQSVVYKLKIGTDVSFVSLFTSAVTEPFDFVISANQVFFANGTDSRKYDGTTLTNWGIAKPAAAPTTSTTSTGITATVGWKYVFTGGNSTTTHQSSPSAASASTGAVTNKRVDVTSAFHPDAQVDKIHVYRTTDGGGGVYFECVGSPIANPGSGTWTFNDTTADVDLTSKKAPLADHNNPPPSGFKLLKNGYFSNRVMGYVNNKLYASNWEEQTGGVGSDIQVGVPEESFNPRNFFQADDAIQGGGPAGDTFLTITGNNTYRLRGDSLSTFSWEKLFVGIGTLDRANFATAGQGLMWMDQHGGIRASDGYTEHEFGNPMFSELSNIGDHSKVSMEYYAGQLAGMMKRVLFVVDGEDSRTLVFDIDNNRWLPPWSVFGRAIAVAQTAGSTFDILLGRSTKKVLKLQRTNNSGDCNDDGATYTASIKTNAIPITPRETPGHVAELEYIAVDRNSTAFADVLILTDDEPINTTFTTSIFANVIPPPLRTQGTNMLEQWFYARKPLARRCAVEIKWPSEDVNFSLIGLGFGSRKGQQ
jgi:hypothetical protein